MVWARSRTPIRIEFSLMISPLTGPALFAPDLHTRLTVARSSQEGNCVSTAFYLAGMVDNHAEAIDTYYDQGVLCSLLDRCVPLDHPLPGSLVAWHDLRDEDIPIDHMGLVVASAPLLITHRPGYALALHEREPLDVIYSSCPFYSECPMRFYAPTRL